MLLEGAIEFSGNRFPEGASLLECRAVSELAVVSICPREADGRRDEDGVHALCPGGLEIGEQAVPDVHDRRCGYAGIEDFVEKLLMLQRAIFARDYKLLVPFDAMPC